MDSQSPRITRPALIDQISALEALFGCMSESEQLPVDLPISTFLSFFRKRPVQRDGGPHGIGGITPPNQTSVLFRQFFRRFCGERHFHSFRIWRRSSRKPSTPVGASPSKQDSSNTLGEVLDSPSLVFPFSPPTPFGLSCDSPEAPVQNAP